MERFLFDKNPLLVAEMKIKRANDHIDSLGRILPDMALGDGYHFAVRSNNDNGRVIVGIDYAPVPDVAYIIVGEAIYQLRSALDVAVVALAKSNGATSTKDVYFPIAKNASDWIDRGTSKKPGPRRKIDKLNSASVSVIDAYNVYPGGNDIIVGLGRLCNTDKHSNFIGINFELSNLIQNYPCQSAEQHMVIGEFAGILAAAAARHGQLDENLEVDITQMLGATDESSVTIALRFLNQYTNIAGWYCFTNTDFFSGEPILETLQTISGAVSDMVANLKLSI